MAYENVDPSLIENTTMRKYINDSNNVFTAYLIKPIEGYVIHDKAADWVYMDMNTGEEILKLGFMRGEVSCGPNYDFAANPREFYAVPEDSVPADQIFGGGNGNHEVM